MNAVVYARFSGHRQGEQSIEGQVAEAERFAAAHGLTIVKVYADRAQTGRNDNREQFQLMLADAAKHAFDALIVWKTDRIGRNKEEIALNKYHLKKNGVKIYYVAEAIPDTPEGIILEAVVEGMAAYYSEQLSQNVRRGMRASAQKAQCTGGMPPLGYAVDENKNFVIDPKHAPTVKLIFDLYAEGKSVTEIADEVNARGLRNQRGNPFSAKSMIRLLNNKKYIGVYTYKDELVLEYVIKLVQDMDLMEFIAENTYQYYLAQNTDTTYMKSLQKALAETEKSISNLLRAIEAGIFNSSTKERLDELEDQKMELKSALAAAKLKEDLGLKKEHILFFLHQFTNMDYTDIDCQRRLIKIFLNSVFVYDDKVVLTFNYSGDNRTMTLKEIDAGLQQGVRIPETNACQKRGDGLCHLLFLCGRGSNNQIQPAGGRLGIAGLDGDTSLRFACGKSATSPFRCIKTPKYHLASGRFGI